MKFVLPYPCDANSSVVAVTGVHQDGKPWLTNCQPTMRTDAQGERLPSASTVAKIVIMQSMKHRDESNKPVGQLVVHRRRIKCQRAFNKVLLREFWSLRDGSDRKFRV